MAHPYLCLHRNLVKIVTAQLQQCLLALSFSLGWPEFLTAFAKTMWGWWPLTSAIWCSFHA